MLERPAGAERVQFCDSARIGQASEPRSCAHSAPAGLINSVKKYLKRRSYGNTIISRIFVKWSNYFNYDLLGRFRSSWLRRSIVNSSPTQDVLLLLPNSYVLLGCFLRNDRRSNPRQSHAGRSPLKDFCRSVRNRSSMGKHLRCQQFRLVEKEPVSQCQIANITQEVSLRAFALEEWSL